jgi:hypothetical protein
MSWLRREVARAAASNWPTWPLALFYALATGLGWLFATLTGLSDLVTVPVALLLLGIPVFLLVRRSRPAQDRH